MIVTTTSRSLRFDEVNVQGSVLDKYEEQLGLYGALLECVKQAAAQFHHALGDRKIWHINSTAFGGGVAEMLPSHICLMRELGFEVGWLVFKPCDQEFFQFTKGLHNALHNKGGVDLGALMSVYRMESEAGSAELGRLIAPDDMLFVHDPQPLGAAASFLKAHPHPAVWRCHIGHPHKQLLVRETWARLTEFLHPFQRIVLSDPAYQFNVTKPTEFIQPSICPFSYKNRHYEELPGDQLNDAAQILGAHASSTLLGILASRYFLHVSRWDALKGIDRVIDAYAQFHETKANTPDLPRLVVAGPDPKGVSDDPEGEKYYRLCEAMCEALPEDIKNKVYLTCLSMDDANVNAEIVGRLQQNALGVFQLSREEGFGLTSTEALFRSRPLIVSTAFGLRKQVKDGVNGVVIGEPNIEANAAAQMAALARGAPELVKMAARAREICIQSSTQIARIPEWFGILTRVVNEFEASPYGRCRD